MKKSIATSIFLILATTVAVPHEPNSASRITFQRNDKSLFVSGEGVAQATNFDFKVVSKSLVTFCREGDGGLCIPIRLTAENHKFVDDDVLIEARVLSSTLRYNVTEQNGKIVVKKNGDGRKPKGDDASAFNADWHLGRGFQVGDTLPNIPLTDLDGQEVRFSKFLGKRYILYCWASW